VSEHGNSAVNLIDKQGYTPVHWAVIEGTQEIVRYLLDLDADFENGFNNERGQKPIHWVGKRELFGRGNSAHERTEFTYSKNILENYQRWKRRRISTPF
jgi:ankyrin repeat protein